MEFVNHTPFPALAFEGIDQRGQGFHTVVLRQTFTWNDAGELVFADDQQPLCEADEFFDENLQGSVRQESDLCAYKPRCDVIVNATAYPPQPADGSVPERFEVRLSVMRPGTPVPIPARPHGLNPLMPASDEAMRIWQAEVERVKHADAQGERLIDKVLVVTGERRFVKLNGWTRAAAALLKIGTIGIVRFPYWRVTRPEPAQPVPIRLERAFGGECRIDADHSAAGKVPQKYRLTVEQTDAHPDVARPPVAHDAYPFNPVGQGYTRDWFLASADVRSVAATQIEYPSRPIGLDDFNRARRGKLDGGEWLVAGLGVRPKGHPERAKLVGTIDEAFIESNAALPKDFDFAVWNAAWPDQQVDALRGDELIRLVNLCAPDTPGVTRDTQGNAVLTLALPGHLPFLLVRFENGAIGELAARLDTLLIDLNRRQVSCVWRATLSKQPLVRVLEARMLSGDDARAVTTRMPTEQEEVAHG
ncbi:DUF2169 family type VI secretion system accessory protein [Trinickia soli]|uniref:DUF2169 family type VI secretion system accessory protein n=1 Tax=Trinickia soli TaxID=380675 RepID=UPI003FA3D806